MELQNGLYIAAFVGFLGVCAYVYLELQRIGRNMLSREEHDRICEKNWNEMRRRFDAQDKQLDQILKAALTRGARRK